MDRRPPFPADFQLVLASQSPRRHSLLRDIGVPFTVVASAAEEGAGDEPVRVLTERNARAKLHGAILPENVFRGAFVLATDTLVTVGGRVMGKPASAGEAAQMLGLLSGRTHQVVSAIAVGRVSGGDEPATLGESRVASALTEVVFTPLSHADIDAYVASEEWRGKAGAYAVQGLAGTFVSEMRGEYSNVVGLPLCLLARMFREAGFDLVGRTWL